MKQLLIGLQFVLLSATWINAQNLNWVRQFTGSGYEVPTVVALDGAGNIFSAGYFDGTVDADPGPGTTIFNSGGYSDIFVTKLDASGNFIWAKQMGGVQAEAPRVIAVTAAGEVIIGGEFNGIADFDPGPGIANLSSVGGNDLFYVKLDASGNFVWARSIGSAGSFSSERCFGLKIDVSGDILATGSFQNTIDMDPGAGSFPFTSFGFDDGFVLRLTSAGNFVWAKRIGGSGYDGAGSLALDAAGNIIYGGAFSNTIDLDPGVGTVSVTSNGNSDIFISKLDAAGNFVWAKIIGGSDSESGPHLTLDASDNIFYVGQFAGTVDFDPGTGTVLLSSPAIASAFVSKLDASGNYVWAKAFGGSPFTTPGNLVSLANGDLTIAGLYNGTSDFDPGPATYNLVTAGNYDGFVMRLDGSGNFVWAFSLGSNQFEAVFQIAKDAVSNVYVTGHFAGTVDFDPGTGVHNLSPVGTWDGYLMKLGNCALPAAPTNTSTITTICPQQSVTLTATGVGTLHWYASPSGGVALATGGSFTTPLLTGSIAYYVSDSTCAEGSRTAVTVTVIPNTFATISPQACGPYTSPSGHVWTSSGTYSDTISNALGCDSIITVQLSLGAASSSNITADACYSYTSPSGHIWTSSGTYLDTISNASGCDSIVTVHLTIRNRSVSTISASVCYSYTSPSGHVWTSSGTYLDTIPNVAGCDSVITVQLTILGSSTSTISPSACDVYTSPSGNYVWSTSGTYLDTIPNLAGCDSFITINLTVTTVDVSVTNNSPTLVSNALGASWQWIYCDSVVVSGAANASFTAVVSGSYAVVVTQNGCMDTSACVAVVVNGLEGGDFEGLKVYPNPTSGVVFVDFGGYFDGVTVEVRNALGQLVRRELVVSGDRVMLDIEGSAGVYFVKVRDEDGRGAWFKVVKR